MPRLPVPTDSFYKFYALFSMTLFFSSIYFIYSSYQASNERAFTLHEKIKILESKDQKSEIDEIMLIHAKERLRMSEENESFEIPFLLYFGVLAGLLMTTHGIYLWKNKLQNHLDSMILREKRKALLENRILCMEIKRKKLESEKLELEIELLKESI